MKRGIALRIPSIAALLLCAVCSGCRTRPLDSHSVVYATGEPMWDLSTKGFIEEMVFSQATERTPNFNDYTKGSYEVHKGDLTEAVGAFRTEKDIPVLAVLAMGPSGKLKRYNILTLVEDTEQPGAVRVNELVFTQNRVTSKFTSVRRRREIDAVLDHMTGSPLLRDRYPAKHMLYPDHSDMSVHVAIADWRNPEPVVRHADHATLSGDAPEIEEFWRQFGTLLDDMTLTYSTYLPRAYLYPEGGDME